MDFTNPISTSDIKDIDKGIHASSENEDDADIQSSMHVPEHSDEEHAYNNDLSFLDHRNCNSTASDHTIQEPGNDDDFDGSNHNMKDNAKWDNESL